MKKNEKTVSSDLEKEQTIVAPSSIFDVNQNLKYENFKQKPLLDYAFAVSYNVGFVF